MEKIGEKQMEREEVRREKERKRKEIQAKSLPNYFYIVT
jgi:hypothetical protein